MSRLAEVGICFKHHGHRLTNRGLATLRLQLILNSANIAVYRPKSYLLLTIQVPVHPGQINSHKCTTQKPSYPYTKWSKRPAHTQSRNRWTVTWWTSWIRSLMEAIHKQWPNTRKRMTKNKAKLLVSKDKNHEENMKLWHRHRRSMRYNSSNKKQIYRTLTLTPQSKKDQICQRNRSNSFTNLKTRPKVSSDRLCVQTTHYTNQTRRHLKTTTGKWTNSRWSGNAGMRSFGNRFQLKSPESMKREISWEVQLCGTNRKMCWRSN